MAGINQCKASFTSGIFPLSFLKEKMELLRLFFKKKDLRTFRPSSSYYWGMPISKNPSGKVPRKTDDVAARIGDHALRMGEHAVSTVRIIITAEERLRQRIRAVARVALATIFFAITGLISLGANVTIALAKKVTQSRGSNSVTSEVRAISTLTNKAALPRSPKRHFNHRAKLAARKPKGPQMRGVASWYGNEFHNRKTASGVLFDTLSMMAAHRSLPFGTLVRVTNLRNHQSCVVEITDRGPFSHGRIIDLSHAAAEQIGMMESGIARVQLEVVGHAAPFGSDELAFAVHAPAVDRLAPSTGSRLNVMQAYESSTSDMIADRELSGH
jgi:rare lipoprotein A